MVYVNIVELVNNNCLEIVKYIIGICIFMEFIGFILIRGDDYVEKFKNFV